VSFPEDDRSVPTPRLPKTDADLIDQRATADRSRQAVLSQPGAEPPSTDDNKPWLRRTVLAISLIGCVAFVTHWLTAKDCSSLSACVDLLRDQGNLPKDARAQVPPVSKSLLGNPLTTTDGDSRPVLGSPCYAPRSFQVAPSLTHAKITYNSLRKAILDLSSSQAAALSAQQEGTATLELHNTFVRTSIGVYDPASQCRDEPRDIVTWEWGAERVVLNTNVASAAGLKTQVEALLGTSLDWKHSGAGVAEADDVVLAYSTSRIVTSSSDPVTTTVTDPVMRGTMVKMPPDAPGDLAISVQSLHRGLGEVSLMTSGRRVISSCGSARDPEALRIKFGQLCVLELGPASVLSVLPQHQGAELLFTTIQYRSIQEREAVGCVPRTGGLP
jgi:hypothetical protein